jgi:hypothetical protein
MIKTISKLLILLTVFQTTCFAAPKENFLTKPMFVAAMQWNSFKTWNDAAEGLGLSDADKKYFKKLLADNNLSGPLPQVRINPDNIMVMGHPMFIYPTTFGAVIKMDEKFIPFFKGKSLEENFQTFKNAPQTSRLEIFQHLFENSAHAVVGAVLSIGLTATGLLIAYLKGKTYNNSVMAIAGGRLTGAFQRLSNVNCTAHGQVVSADDCLDIPTSEIMEAEEAKCRKENSKDGEALRFCGTQAYINSSKLAKVCIVSRLEYGTFAAEVPNYTRWIIDPNQGKWVKIPEETNVKVAGPILNPTFMTNLQTGIKTAFKPSASLDELNKVGADEANKAFYEVLKAYCKGEDQEIREGLNMIMNRNKLKADAFFELSRKVSSQMGVPDPTSVLPAK